MITKDLPQAVMCTVQSAGAALLVSYLGGHKFTNLSGEISNIDALKIGTFPLLAFFLVTSVTKRFFKDREMMGYEIKSEKSPLPGLIAGAFVFTVAHLKGNIPLGASLVYTLFGAAFSLGNVLAYENGYFKVHRQEGSWG